jgi:protein-tyrosine-phosphatase
LTAYSLIIALEAAAKKLVLELGASESKVKLWKIKDPYGDDQGEYDKCGLDIKKKVVQLKRTHVRKFYVKGGT